MAHRHQDPAPLDPYEGASNQERAGRIDGEPAVGPQKRPAGLTVAVLNLDRPDLILPMLDTLGDAAAAFVARGLGFEVVVGDTGSRDAEVLRRYTAKDPWLTVLPNLDYHFSRCCNACVASAPVGYDAVLLLNNDVILPSPEPLLAMYQQLLDRPEVAVVGVQLLYPDGSVQHCGVDIVRTGFRRGLPWHPHRGAAPSPSSVSTVSVHRAIAVTGACLMVRRSMWDVLGGLDEEYFIECQDVDLCLAARRLGYEVSVVAAGDVLHLEGATRGDECTAHLPDRRTFLRRWSAFLEANLL
jgi:GT2 family glycosyltransferase